MTEANRPIPRKLSRERVLEARRRRRGGETLKSIAIDLGVSESAICRICLGQAYADLHDELEPGGSA